MLRLSHVITTGLLLLGLSANLSAETVNLPQAPTQSTEYSIKVPGHGMTMEMVLNQFGEPVEKISPVGEPPISRWIYTNFTVYFESEFVIHAVVNH